MYAAYQPVTGSCARTQRESWKTAIAQIAPKSFVYPRERPRGRVFQAVDLRASSIPRVPPRVDQEVEVARQGRQSAAGGTEPPPFAREREKELGGAVGAADAGEASLEDAAVEVPRDGPPSRMARQKP